MDRADILIAIHEKGQAEDLRKNEKAISVVELRVKCGAATHERHSSSTRHLISQRKTITVSHHVLVNILKEHLETCFA